MLRLEPGVCREHLDGSAWNSAVEEENASPLARMEDVLDLYGTKEQPPSSCSGMCGLPSRPHRMGRYDTEFKPVVQWTTVA